MRRSDWEALGLLLLFLVNAGMWISTIPYNNAPDEMDHFAMVDFIARRGHLPVYGKDIGAYWINQETKEPLSEEEKRRLMGGERFRIEIRYTYAAQPPLAHLLAAVFARALPFPSAAYLRARLASAVCGLLTCLLVYRLSLLFDPNPAFAIGALAFASLLPGLTFVSSYVNSDAFASAAAAAFLYCCAKGYLRGWRWTTVAGLGLSAGSVALSRYNAYAVFPVGAVLLLSDGELTRKERLARLGFALGLAAALSGWFFVRNAALYGDPLGLRTTLDGVRRLYYVGSPQAFRLATGFRMTFLSSVPIWKRIAFVLGLATLRIPLVSASGTVDAVLVSSFLAYHLDLFTSFCGRFGWMVVFLPRVCYAAYGLILIASLTGNALDARSWPGKRRAAVLCAFLGAIVVEYGMVAWNAASLDYQPQGRYFLPLIAPISVLVMNGIWKLERRPKRRRYWAWGLTILMAACNGAAYWTRIWPARPI